jgi:hypothetical protein
VDPFAISIYDNEWANRCNDRIVAINSIRRGDRAAAERMLSDLSEPNETRLGVSQGRPQGRGVSGKQAFDLYKALAASQAAKSGIMSELADCDLFVEGIGRDKISDVTTNVIRDLLIEYTQAQCHLHNIPLRGTVSSGRLWEDDMGRWRERFVPLPTYKGTRVILVPKHIVRRRLALESDDYYNNHVLNFLQEEHLKAHSSLVEALKNGRKRVTKKRLKEQYPFRKEWLAEFSQQHPAVLEEYKKQRYQNAKRGLPGDISLLHEEFDEAALARAMISTLNKVVPGNDAASEYHKFMIGVLEFLFWPNLIYPVKEDEIHEGRKRIDISYTNAAEEGFFHRVHASPQMRAIHVFVECKNYSKDPANPEVDQIAGRFSHTRGRLGLLLFRQTSDYEKLVARCRDTALDDRGYILPLGDEQIIAMLSDVAARNRREVDRRLDALLSRLLA